MAGRHPKPTALRELEGNPGGRPLNTSEPHPDGVPTCPKHLDKTARVEWRRISRELLALGLLTSIDRAALAAYCMAWSRWARAEEKVQQTGEVIKSSKSGYPIQNPYVGVANTAMDHMRKLLVEFGMTPASRSRIQLDPGGSADPLETFMRGLGAADEIGQDADATPTIES